MLRHDSYFIKLWETLTLYSYIKNAYQYVNIFAVGDGLLWWACFVFNLFLQFQRLMNFIKPS